MPTFAVYTDPEAFLTFANYAGETSSLIGGRTTLTNTTAVGAVSLPVGNVTNFVSGQQAWILDGLASETVTITGTPAGNALPVAATTYAHTNGASVSSAGTAGCLASVILSACRMADKYCAQRAPGQTDALLYAISRTETYSLATLRAHISREYQLEVFPYHFPVQSVTSASLQLDTSTGNAVDLTGIVLPEGGRSPVVPETTFLGSSLQRSLMPAPWLRDPNVWLTLTYTGGPITGATIASVPWEIQQAVWWFTMHILGYRVNPTGAASVHMGDTSREFRMRGETGAKAKSLLEMNAEDLLAPYRAQF